jgi:hypothetical protein
MRREDSSSNRTCTEQEIQFLLQDINVFCHMKIKDEKNKEDEVYWL